ncbi:MAG: O-antigen ligase family protein [Burkholderiales bacterium]|nr:O-antigen ligase family protein [Burkholderiales bacterium]
MKGVLFVLAFMAVALFAGLVMAVLGGIGLLLLFPLAAALLVASNYRIGVVLLAIIIPLAGSVLVPKAEGLNPYTYATAAAVVGLMLKRFFSPEKMVWPPRVMIFSFLIPLLAAFVIGVPHLAEGARNMLKLNSELRFDTLYYFRQYVYKPMLLVGFSILLANAVSDSKRPERFVTVFGVSAACVVVYVIAFTLYSGVGWGAHRLVISKAGMHYNEYGQLFALAFGPLLFVAFAEKGFSRFVFGSMAMIVLIGLVFNFARAGMIATIVTVGIFLWRRKSIGVGLLVVGLAFIVVALAPDEWRLRMMQGSSEFGTSVRGERYGELTSGRVQAWIYLFPDVALSPIFGRGIGSTLWNSAVTSGLYPSASHPHNMYLQLLLDIGVVGLVFILYFYFSVLAVMRKLSNDSGLHPRLRAFFAGSWASLVGMLFLAFTGGNWYPSSEQAFLWISIGMAMAYWHRARQESPEIVLNPVSAGATEARTSALVRGWTGR